MEEGAEDEYTVRQKINKDGNKSNKTCRARIDKLAEPKRRAILALYQNHAYHLPRDKVEKIKQYLQELYAMTPEETEKYFLQLRKEAKKMSQRKKVKEALKKLFNKKKRQRQQNSAYNFIEKLFEKGMRHAFNHPVPPLISVRLRNLSDIVLEQICDLRNIDHPKREDPDQRGLFLIAVADWIAIAIEHVYYGVQLKKNAELQAIEEKAAETAAKRKEDGKDKHKKHKGHEGRKAHKKHKEGIEGLGEDGGSLGSVYGSAAGGSFGSAYQSAGSGSVYYSAKSGSIYHSLGSGSVYHSLDRVKK